MNNYIKTNKTLAYDRSFGIQKMFYLHIQKEYKKETLFVAAAIFDNYIRAISIKKMGRL